MSIYQLKLMFEWNGGCIWCDNNAAFARFDVGPIECRLPLSKWTLERLETLSIWHDQSLNWNYPPDPGPWTEDEYKRFELAAQEILQIIQDELGEEFSIHYVSL